MGSVNAAFQFVSYKIDLFQFSARQDLSYLGLDALDSEKVNIKISFRPPVFDKSNALYMGGIEATFSYPFKDEESLFDLQAGIEGIFQVVDKSQMEPDLEEDMVKYQIPAILFPYLRAAVTGFFASAGLGSFIFPLINVREMGKRIGDELKIQVVE